jgi:hypothetical protein
LAREFKIDYDYEHRFAEHEHESFVRHACDLSFEAGFFEALAKKNGEEGKQASRVTSQIKIAF